MFTTDAECVVNTVNTVGVMGKGVALECKKRYPAMFEVYKRLCEQHKIAIGVLYIWTCPDKRVLLFPTKKHWRNPSKLEYLEKGLDSFKRNYKKMGLKSIAFPKLGCNCGGLDWESQVRPLMEKYLKDIPIDIKIYV